MGYSRAGWRSGLTYRQTCETCNTTVTYTDDKLGFRPWFADGFVYCPTCNKPLRHNEKYAINKNVEQNVDLTNQTAKEKAAFCTQCGNALRPQDNFCSNCGVKL